MKLEVQVEFPAGLADRLRARGDRVAKAAAAALDTGALMITGAAQRLMGEPKSGASYGDHVASAPGEAPAVDLGDLTRSVVVDRANGDPEHGAAVHARAPYAPFLELGAPRAGIEPRPFLRPAYAAQKTAIVAIVTDAVRNALSGGG